MNCNVLGRQIMSYNILFRLVVSCKILHRPNNEFNLLCRPVVSCDNLGRLIMSLVFYIG